MFNIYGTTYSGYSGTTAAAWNSFGSLNQQSGSGYGLQYQLNNQHPFSQLSQGFLKDFPVAKEDGLLCELRKEISDWHGEILRG